MTNQTHHHRGSRRIVAAIAAFGTAAALGAGAVTTSPSANAVPPTVNQQDITYLTVAAQSNLAEIALGKLARRQADRPAVRRFGREMVQDHKQQYASLQALAATLQVTLPTRPSREQRRVARAWSGVDGRAFDCAYVPFQWGSHELTIARTEMELAEGSDPQVRAAAQASLPVLQKHLEHVTRLLHRLGRC